MSGHKKDKRKHCLRKKGKNNPSIAKRLERMEREFQAFKVEVRIRMGDVVEPDTTENRAACSDGA